jgi:S-adenosylmethionine decarboxylase
MKRLHPVTCLLLPHTCGKTQILHFLFYTNLAVLTIYCPGSMNTENHYQPGLHIIAKLRADAVHLQRYEAIQNRLRQLVVQENLQQLGEVYHNFEPGGFTGVVCLSESHISIHTWPEHGLINFDIYLSNFQRINDLTVQRIYQAVVDFFKAQVLEKTEISR